MIVDITVNLSAIRRILPFLASESGATMVILCDVKLKGVDVGHAVVCLIYTVQLKK
jgi:hypothetical protein